MFTFQKKFNVLVGEIVFHCHGLSARNLRAAAQAVSDAQVRNWHAMGPDILEVLRNSGSKAAAPSTDDKKAPDAAATLKARTEARYAEYDPFVVARLGIDGWSISDPINEKNIDQIVDALTEEQLAKLHHGILDESLPPLEAEAQKVAEGKDSAPSTST